MSLRPNAMLGRLTRALRAILGVPDYERYLEHLLERHPDQVPLTRDQFAHERMASRYNRPGSRCC